MTEHNVKQAGAPQKKKIPVWVRILRGLAVFPLLLIILLVAVLLVIGIVSGSSEDDAKETMNSRENSVRQEYVLEAQDSAVELEEDVVEESVSAEGTKESEENATEETGKENSEKYDFSSLEAISEICGLKATVQEDYREGYVDTIEGENPYDVVWDYGSEYTTYVDACDWSLVFDADYYMDTFPMLAMLYHYDEDLLLQHFQTVGIHEGRQGSADFNVFAYLTNGSDEAWEAFEYNYEGYYFYYMLNYETEKNINTVVNADGTTPKVQHKEIYTSAQLAELGAVNKYRAEIGEAPLTLDSEMCAMANYRAYINAHDNWEAHKWMRANLDEIDSWCIYLGTTVYSENTATTRARTLWGRINADSYAGSKSHYEAMTNGRYNYTGMSNTYVGDDSTSQFDVFTDDIETAMH